jgi:molybdopterin-containing oxidoreductase family iron-sulfur binding subunit
MSLLEGSRSDVPWRSLEEREGRGGPEAAPRDEFAPGAADPPADVGRREFLTLLGATAALAAGAGCGQKPAEKILPYAQKPEEILPGRPLAYATAIPRHAHALGVLVETHEGRPVKVEGNPQHPASLGATDAAAQAALLSLYDPDRSQVVLRQGQIATWPGFLAALNAALERERARNGAGLRLLTEPVTSPTLAAQLDDLRAIFPESRWHAYAAASPTAAAREGARRAFGRELDLLYRFEQADVVVSLESDFLSEGPAAVRQAHDFYRRRRVETGFGPDGRRIRLYVAESTPSLAGAAADHRLPVASGDIADLARRLAAGVEGSDRGAADPASSWAAAAARDLREHAGRGLVVAGAVQPPEVHARAAALNARLGNLGRTAVPITPVEASAGGRAASLAELADDIRAGRVGVLLILGGNPVYDAPADLEFGRLLREVPFTVRLGLYDDETSALSLWHVPEAHALEAWGDLRAFDGTATLVQPLLVPLYGGRSIHELVAAVAGAPGKSGYEIVRDAWKARRGDRGFEAFWRSALHEGFVPGSAAAAEPVSLRGEPSSPAPEPEDEAGDGGRPAPSLELAFRPDPALEDGRFAPNAWLQELPRPFTKIAWDNAALVSPATARRLGLETGDVVRLTAEGRTVEGPVWLLPGQADGTVTVHLGHGRTRAGRVGTGVGFNAYPLRTSERPWVVPGLRLSKAGRRRALATTQHHHRLEGRDHVRFAPFGRERAEPVPGHGPAPSMYPPVRYPGYAWGMAIDLNACFGCNACVVACQAENNVPAVGREEVLRGREMHWLRIDHYFVGEPANPGSVFQPMLCQHCEKAPCEVVCPVAATTHSAEGLNEMTYNRCVGTRYCSNNCPWKVRRFNFFDYAARQPAGLRLLANPDVTIRERGVMEKCTYCVQRINRARVEAKKEGRALRDGEVVTACQAVCPSGAIVFGDLNRPESRVARLKASPLNYAVLAHLNTVPRTTYLARLRDPNPDLEEK